MDAKAIARQWAAGEEISPEDTRQYLISIYSETRSVTDDVDNETATTQIEIDHESIDADMLMRYAQDYGISEASSSHISRDQNSLWFYSVTPRQDRAYFEQGVETYYSLHVHAIDDKRLNAQDYQQIAELINVRLDVAPSLEPPELATPQPDHEF